MYVCKSVLLLFPFTGKFVVFIAAANFALVSLSECDKEGGETERVNARDRYSVVVVGVNAQLTLVLSLIRKGMCCGAPNCKFATCEIK